MAKKSALLSAIGAAVGPGSSGKQSKTKGKVGPVGSLGNRKDTRPHRAGLVNVTGYFDPAVKSSIRAIQMKHPSLTQQDILEEALEYVFGKYEVPQTARLHRHRKEKG